MTEEQKHINRLSKEVEQLKAIMRKQDQNISLMSKNIGTLQKSLTNAIRSINNLEGILSKRRR